MIIKKIFLFSLSTTFCLVLFAGEGQQNLSSGLNTDAALMQEKAAIPEGGLFRQDREKFPQQAARSIDEEEKFIRHEISSYVLYIPSRKAKSMAGKVSIIESEFEYSYNLKLFGQLPVTLSLANEYINIDKTVPLDLPAHLVGLSTGIETTLPFFGIDKTYISLGVNPSFYSDDWNFRSSAFRIPSDTYLIYTASDRLTLIAGVAVAPDFKNAVLPIIGCIYKPNDKWALEMTSDASNITYSLNNKVSLFFEMSSPIGSEYEVKRGERRGVVLDYNEMLAGAGVKYKANKFTQVSLLFGGAFNRYIRYRDEDGKVSIKNGLYTEFRLDIAI